ncbi:MAG: 3-phosphoshikimate 1-carboxyvinyltransferase [Arenicellales bacterium]|nr:3-phosphoshikimate 1-carboxyvinyltransferase [Arenicellales bacterium]
MRYLVRPGGQIIGDIRVPGDKSISHRAVILGSIATGDTGVTGLLEGTDVLATIEALRSLGVEIQGPEQGRLLIRGVGLTGLRTPNKMLDLGNSGTAMRLLTGLLAGQKFPTTLVGDESLSRRPMRRVTNPLAQMGARVDTAANGTPPLSITPVNGLHGIHYALPVASAQVKSALLLAGLYANGETCIEEPVPTRDHTERMLTGFGYPCTQHDHGVCVVGGGVLHGVQIDVPADLSSAAFFIVAATIAHDSKLRLSHVGVNPTRAGVLDILREMGAHIELDSQREVCGEPVADLVVQSAPLKGIDIPPDKVPLAIDEFPVLCIAAASAQGITTIRGATELRHKESDRISAMVQGLRELGVEVDEYEDGLCIQGGEISGGSVASHGDHRIAMAFCVAGVGAKFDVEVKGCDNIVTSFPGFLETAVRSGLRIDDIS